MLFLVLAAYGSTAVGNRNLINVAEESQSEGEAFIFHVATETQRQTARAKRRRERRHKENDERQARPNFRGHGRLSFVNEQFAFREFFGPPLPSRAPPAFS